MAIVSSRKRKNTRKLACSKKDEKQADDQINIFLGTKKWYHKPSRASRKHRAKELGNKDKSKNPIYRSVVSLDVPPSCKKKLLDGKFYTVGDVVNTSIQHMINYFGFSDEQIQEIKTALNKPELALWQEENVSRQESMS